MKKNNEKKRSFTLLMPIAAILLLLILWGARNWQRTILLPEEVAGVWTTNEPRYQGRFLELYSTFVIIGAGTNDVPKVQVIDSVKQQQSGNVTSYAVHSTDLDGNEYDMTLLFDPTHGGEIHFNNQGNIIWRRQPDEASR